MARESWKSLGEEAAASRNWIANFPRLIGEPFNYLLPDALAAEPAREIFHWRAARNAKNVKPSHTSPVCVDLHRSYVDKINKTRRGLRLAFGQSSRVVAPTEFYSPAILQT
jgi:hypothetical protein